MMKISPLKVMIDKILMYYILKIGVNFAIIPKYLCNIIMYLEKISLLLFTAIVLEIFIDINLKFFRIHYKF